MEDQKKRIILTEGSFDKDFLQKVLPKEIINESSFIVGQGYSSLISKAKSISLHNKLPLYLIMDSDTNDRFQVNEKKESIQSIFNMLGTENKINVFFFVPQLEIVFLEDEDFVAKHFQKINIESLLSPNKIFKSNSLDRKTLLHEIDEEEIKKLQKNTSIKELIALIEA